MTRTSLKSDAVLERLMRLHPETIDLSLGRIERLLDKLGNPHLSLPPVVHVAGTNGKGSVLAFLRAFLEAAGYRVHVYTSPHLVSFHERIRLAGEPVSEEELTALLEECERANNGDPITFFEATTAAAFLAFSRHDADVVLLETGLGGRLDATNVVARPLVTAITPVSMDHQDYLGNTPEAIAKEKAGILKPGVPCILAAQPRPAQKPFTQRAADLSVVLLHEGKDWSARVAGGHMAVTSGGRVREDLPLPGLAGKHQHTNAAQAIACLDVLRANGFDVSDTAIAQGLQSVDWPARLQHLTEGRLVALLPEGWELWLDGGHNPAAGKAIASQTRKWRDKPLHLICGMLKTKNPAGFMKPLLGRAKSLQAVSIPGEPNTLSAERTAETARAVGFEAREAENVEAAIRHLVEADPTPKRILICGSLYLAGSVLAQT